MARALPCVGLVGPCPAPLARPTYSRCTAPSIHQVSSALPDLNIALVSQRLQLVCRAKSQKTAADQSPEKQLSDTKVKTHTSQQAKQGKGAGAPADKKQSSRQAQQAKQSKDGGMVEKVRKEKEKKDKQAKPTPDRDSLDEYSFFSERDRDFDEDIPMSFADYETVNVSDFDDEPDGDGWVIGDGEQQPRVPEAARGRRARRIRNWTLRLRQTRRHMPPDAIATAPRGAPGPRQIRLGRTAGEGHGSYMYGYPGHTSSVASSLRPSRNLSSHYKPTRILARLVQLPPEQTPAAAAPPRSPRRPLFDREAANNADDASAPPAPDLLGPLAWEAVAVGRTEHMSDGGGGHGGGGPDAGVPAVLRRGGCRMFVLWDLDNKYPETLDHAGLLKRLKEKLGRFGSVSEIQAFCNYQTLRYVPRVWDEAMEMGMEHPLEADNDEPLRCPMCGYRSKDEAKLEKHFKQLHQREHNKKKKGNPNRFGRYMETEKYQRYQDAVRSVLPKRRGFNLEGILKKLDVNVKPVQMGPQTADIALEKAAKTLLETVKVPPREAAPGRGSSLLPAPSTAALGDLDASRFGPGPGTVDVGLEGASADGLPTGTNPSLSVGTASLAGAEERPAVLGQPGEEAKQLRQRTDNPPPKQPVLVLISDDHGFQPLLKLFQSRGWGTITVSSCRLRNTDAQLKWRSLVRDFEP